jgi:imidazolonepropionase-like amidohydrolase
MAPELVAKVGDLVERGRETLRTAHALGVKVCYGSDLLGDMHAHQAGSIGLHLDAGVDPASVLLSLTATPARMMRDGGPRRGGTEGPRREANTGGPLPRDEARVPPLAVAANQRADLIVVDGDVIRDPRVLMDERNVKLVVKAGEVVKCAL